VARLPGMGWNEEKVLVRGKSGRRLSGDDLVARLGEHRLLQQAFAAYGEVMQRKARAHFRRIALHVLMRNPLAAFRGGIGYANRYSKVE